jgi:hypothetical protein
MAALEGELGAIAGAGVGLDLKPKSPATALASFECGKPSKTTVTGVIEGSVIAPIARINRPQTRFKLTYTAAAGKQIPELFEGGVPDTLTTVFAIGAEKFTAQTGLIASETISNQELLEIRATP